jgi:hypothetical protein
VNVHSSAVVDGATVSTYVPLQLAGTVAAVQIAGDEVSVQDVAFSDEYVSVTAPPADVTLLKLSASVAVGLLVEVGGGVVTLCGGVAETPTSHTERI